jgi:hypothetical protein
VDEEIKGRIIRGGYHSIIMMKEKILELAIIIFISLIIGVIIGLITFHDDTFYRGFNAGYEARKQYFEHKGITNE